MLREFAIAVLNDENGISETAWYLLLPLIAANGDCADIISAIKAQDGRFYLPEDFA